MAVDDRISIEEFQEHVRRGDVPVPGVSRFRFVLAILMVIIGVGSVVAGVALIYWKAALILVGLALVVGAYFIDIIKKPVK